MLTFEQAMTLVSGDRLISDEGESAVVKAATAYATETRTLRVTVHIYGRHNDYIHEYTLDETQIAAWSLEPAILLDCGHTETRPHSYITRGYATDAAGKTACYACCAERERAAMIETGRATLYLSYDAERGGYNNKVIRYSNVRVTDWPGVLEFKCGGLRTGRHNIAGKRYDVWFRGPDGFVWHGVQYGENTQIAHCKRTKERAA